MGIGWHTGDGPLQLQRTTYLVKANDDLVSRCKCGDGRVSFPPQMDCPWCGCGWLFTCIMCRKAFTFARAVEIDATWDDLARQDLRTTRKREPMDHDVNRWMGAMQELLQAIEVGKQYVCFDGHIIATDAKGVRINGWHRQHDLSFVPQIKALTDPTIDQTILSSRAYWGPAPC
jgi:hypothetical protein